MKRLSVMLRDVDIDTDSLCCCVWFFRTRVSKEEEDMGMKKKLQSLTELENKQLLKRKKIRLTNNIVFIQI